jgi:hypothetical protein
MTNSRTITRDAADWPIYAPGWADTATIDRYPETSVVTFERAWTLPGMFRDVEPLVVVRVEQVWDAARAEPEPPRVVAGRGDLWADARGDEVASTLADILAALRGTPIERGTAAAEQEGEDG